MIGWLADSWWRSSSIIDVWLGTHAVHELDLYNGIENFYPLYFTVHKLVKEWKAGLYNQNMDSFRPRFFLFEVMRWRMSKPA